MDRAQSKRALAVIRQEPRGVRRAVPARLPIQVQIDGWTFEGHEISLEGFRVDSYIEDLEPGQAIWCTIRLDLAGWVLTLQAQVALAGRNPTQRTSSFEILDMDQVERDLLRRVLKAHLQGGTPSLNELLGRARSQDLLPALRHHGQQPRRRGKGIRLAGIGLGAIGLAGLLAFSIYERTLMVKSNFAAVTAPQVVVRAPSSAQLRHHGLKAGDRVARDQLLGEMTHHELRARLTLARATYDYNQRLVENLRERIAGGASPSGRILASRGGTAREPGASALDRLSLEEAQARIEEFEAARDFERARIAALEMEAQGNTIYSPCTCLVRWARAAGSGEWLKEGDPIFVLVKTGQDDLMVEALVHLSKIDRLALHQRAYISIPNLADPVPARVHAILLETEEQPRAGFPDWVRQDHSLASVLLVPERPISPQYIGTPVKVDFSRLPDLANLAALNDAVSMISAQVRRFANGAAAANEQTFADLVRTTRTGFFASARRAGDALAPGTGADVLWPEPATGTIAGAGR